MINQEANVKQAQWPKSGCFPTNGAWKPATVAFGSTPATISVGSVNASGSEQFSQVGCPFVSGLNGGSCSLALAAGPKLLTAAIWAASEAQSVTSPPFLRNTTTRSKWEKSTGSLTVTSNFLECGQPEYFSSDRLPDNSWPSLICFLPISFLLHSAFCPQVGPHIFFQIVWLWNLSLPLLMDLSKFYRRGKNKSRDGRKGKHLDVVLGKYVISELGLLSKKAALASTALCLLRKLSKSIWGNL